MMSIEQKTEALARRLASKNGMPEAMWELFLVEAYSQTADEIMDDIMEHVRESVPVATDQTAALALETTDSPIGGETLEEWDGTAGTAVAYIRTLEADRARLRAEVGHLRAAITTPEVYYGVIAEEVADAYEKQGAELRQTRAEVERLTAETECGTCGGAPPVSGRPCVCGGSNRASKEAQGLREIAFKETQRADAAEARAARLEEALRGVGYSDPDVPGGVCWCAVDDAYPDEHDAECLAARRALNHEGGANE